VSGVGPDSVAELVASGRAQLIDVRTDEEYQAGHIAEARHIPIDRLTAESGTLDHERPVVLYCRSGDRSGAAAEAFRASGWDAQSMEGGLVAWADEGRPLQPESGTVVQPSGLPPR
jgi:rhodanese-related sulfurtransferase